MNVSESFLPLFSLLSLSFSLRFYVYSLSLARSLSVLGAPSYTVVVGMCCVNGLQSTGEAAGGDNVDEKVDKLFQTPPRQSFPWYKTTATASRTGKKRNCSK
jgi:hypothetical protein